MDLTRSEELFEALCRQDDLPFCRIARRQGARTPDYLVGSFLRRIVVEVKQLDPNPEEQKLEEAFDAGKIVAVGGTPGARVRRAIDDAYPQLRAKTWFVRPGLLVLYDNVHLPTLHLDPYAFKTGMYGLEQVVMTPSLNRSLPWTIVDTVFGPKRKVGPSRNRALSAVGRLYHESADRVALDVYHNVYARVPLKPSRLGTSVNHYRLGAKNPGVLQEWERF